MKRPLIVEKKTEDSTVLLETPEQQQQLPQPLPVLNETLIEQLEISDLTDHNQPQEEVEGNGNGIQGILVKRSLTGEGFSRRVANLTPLRRKSWTDGGHHIDIPGLELTPREEELKLEIVHESSFDNFILQRTNSFETELSNDTLPEESFDTSSESDEPLTPTNRGAQLRGRAGRFGKDSYLAMLGVSAKADNRMSNVEMARADHAKLVRSGTTILEPLKLNSSKRLVDNSFILPSLWRSVIGLFKKDSKSDDSVEVVLSSNSESGTAATKIDHSVASKGAAVALSPQLGLMAREVVDPAKYKAELRKQAQRTLQSGKRNISYLGAAEVLEIPTREIMGKKLMRRVWYSRDKFVKMIQKNVRQIEEERANGQ